MSLNHLKLAAIDELVQQSPEYGEILTLFRGIYSYVDESRGATGISFSPDAANHELRVQSGFPLVNPEIMTVDNVAATAFIAGLLATIGRESREGLPELERISQRLEEGKFDLPLLLGACLQRDRDKIASTAIEENVQAALLEFVLGATLKAALEPLATTLSEEDFSGWQESTCPVCGARAGMAELAGDEGRRYLCCSTCFFKWPYKRLQCPYCGNDESESLTYFTAGDGPTRVDVCRKCTRYLKTRDSRKGHAALPLEVEDLVTIHLDLLAGREGFEKGK